MGKEKVIVIIECEEDNTFKIIKDIKRCSKITSFSVEEIKPDKKVGFAS